MRGDLTSVLQAERAMSEDLYGGKLRLEPDTEGNVYLGMKCFVEADGAISVLPRWKGGVNRKSFGINIKNIEANLVARFQMRVCAGDSRGAVCVAEMQETFANLGFNVQRITRKLTETVQCPKTHIPLDIHI